MSQPSPGAQQLNPGAGREIGRMGLGSCMQAGCPPPRLLAAIGQAPGRPWPSQAQHSLPPRADALAQHTDSPAQSDMLPRLLGWIGSQPCFWLLTRGPEALGSSHTTTPRGPCSWVEQPHADTHQAHDPGPPQWPPQRPDRTNASCLRSSPDSATWEQTHTCMCVHVYGNTMCMCACVHACACLCVCLYS